ERWRQETGDAVEYEPSQEVASEFPEIPAGEFESAVILITPDGKVYGAAEAVFRSLACGGRRWPLLLYDKVPGFARSSEIAYDFVSRHRELASKLTRLLWGRDVRVPTYFISRRIFLRAVGLTYCIAFVSLWLQVDGLIGERGILLLETGFLAIFLAPLQWRMERGRDVAISGIALFLLKFLLFKLMFMSGVVKLTSGDDCWWNLTALDYHYWTQPLPTPIAWW